MRTATVIVAGLVTALVPAAVAMASSPGEPPLVWTPLTPFTSPSSGVVSPYPGSSVDPSSDPDPSADPDAAVGSFTLTMSSDLERAVSVTLTCRPDGGTHPGDVDAACSQLETVGGDVAAIPASGTLCTKEYAPVRATVQGSWNGRSIDFSDQYGNACEANAATGGALFTFWTDPGTAGPA